MKYKLLGQSFILNYAALFFFFFLKVQNKMHTYLNSHKIIFLKMDKEPLVPLRQLFILI